MTKSTIPTRANSDTMVSMARKAIDVRHERLTSHTFSEAEYNMIKNGTISSIRTTRKIATIERIEQLHSKGFAFLADNSYIHSGYRVHYSLKDCLISIFQLHNETLNVWTHLVGSFIFIGLIIHFAIASSSISDINGVKQMTIPYIPTTPSMDIPSWCYYNPNNVLYIENGRHTTQMLRASCLTNQCLPVCPLLAVLLKSPPAMQINTNPSSMWMDHSTSYREALQHVLETTAHPLPRLDQLQHFVEDSNLLEDISRSVAGINHEIAQFKELVGSQLRDFTSQRLLDIHTQVNDVTTFLQSSARHVMGKADPPIHYMRHELQSIRDSLSHGIHILSQAEREKQMKLHSPHVVPQWPIFVFMASAAICLTLSAIFHLLFVYSQRAFVVLSRLDYAGISILIAGSFYPLVYYGFFCDPIYQKIYLTSISVLAAITFAVTMIPAFESAKFLLLRTGMFLILGFFGLVPLSHLIAQVGFYHPHVQKVLSPLMIMAFLYTSGAIIYAMKFPERYYPGKFDLWFSSHQLWHICVVLAALVHFMNAVAHYEWRLNATCDAN